MRNLKWTIGVRVRIPLTKYLGVGLETNSYQWINKLPLNFYSDPNCSTLCCRTWPCASFLACIIAGSRRQILLPVHPARSCERLGKDRGNCGDRAASPLTRYRGVGLKTNSHQWINKPAALNFYSDPNCSYHVRPKKIIERNRSVTRWYFYM